LHVGLFSDYCEVVWEADYRVLQEVPGNVCDYPRARNLVLLAVALGSEVLIRFILEQSRQNWSATLRHFAIRPMEKRTAE
jgi:hypothetical protein